MWDKKRATSAEGQNYSNSRVPGYGQLGGCPKIMCKFLEKLLSLKENELVMVCYNYTKWSGRSCWTNWTMVSLGPEKTGFGETNEMVISFKNSYKTLLTFFNKDIEMF